MRTTRLRQKIKKFLRMKRGEANTTEILEHVNSTMRHGKRRGTFWEIRDMCLAG